MIVVTYQNEILGAGVVWEGHEDRLEDIRNIPARNLARLVAQDGRTRQAGMWTVERVDGRHGEGG